MQSKKQWLIIQAGGLGTRLRPLTDNRPKCLVPVGGDTILSHAIKTFGENVIVIGDYLSEVIENYIEVFFPYVKLVKTNTKGTCSGLNEALRLIEENDSIIFSWSDLLFERKPQLDFEKSTIGLSRTFPCRYQYENAKYSKRTDSTEGVAGFFVFPNKSYLKDVPNEGSFVGDFLRSKNFEFDCHVWLDDTHEIGTLSSLKEFEMQRIKSRFFNDVIIQEDKVTKRAKDSKFIDLIQNEISWYEKIHELSDFSEVPKLLRKEPFEIERRKGDHPYVFSKEERKEVMSAFSKFFTKTHSFHTCEINESDMKEMYLTKVLNRVKKYSKLIHNFNDEKITINGTVCKNPWFDEKDVYQIAQGIESKNFCLIHGDPTFSNSLWDQEQKMLSIFDPRGKFGSSFLVGDPAYDWAKLYYSAVDEYDRTNTRDFYLRKIDDGWEIQGCETMLDEFFWKICPIDKRQILLRLVTIWFSLIGYVENDIDAMNFAFLKGCFALNKLELK